MDARYFFQPTQSLNFGSVGPKSLNAQSPADIPSSQVNPSPLTINPSASADASSNAGGASNFTSASPGNWTPMWSPSNPPPKQTQKLDANGNPIAAPNSGTVVRAQDMSGQPGDVFWRQNLATFGAGDFTPIGTDPSQSGDQSPWGIFFNPLENRTGVDLFNGMGAPVGGGNAPLFGSPQTWLDAALAAQTAPAPEVPAAAAPAPTDTTATTDNPWADWEPPQRREAAFNPRMEMF